MPRSNTFAQIVFSAYCGVLVAISAHGGGSHLELTSNLDNVRYLTSVCLRPASYHANCSPPATQLAIASEDLYVITMLFLKTSLAIFFARIVIKPWMLHSIQLAIALNTAMCLANFFYIIFRCGDPRRYFDEVVAQALGAATRCSPRRVDLAFIYLNAAVTAGSDWLFALLPVPLLWSSTMDARTKLSVGFILSLGALSSVCSLVRFRYLAGLTDYENFFCTAPSSSPSPHQRKKKRKNI